MTMALATQLDLERFLQIDFDNPADPVAAQLLESAEAHIKAFLSRTALEQTAVVGEVHDGAALTAGVLRPLEYPLVSVQALTEDGTSLVEGTDFLRYPNMVVRVVSGSTLGTPYPFKYGFRNVTIDYTAGYAAGSPELLLLRDVTVRAAGRVFQAAAAAAAAPKEAGAVKQVQLDGSDSVTYRDVVGAVGATMSTVTLTADEKAAITHLRRWGW